MLKNCFSLPKLLYFSRTSTYFIHTVPLEKYDQTVRDGLSKVCNVNFDDISSTQLALLAEMGGLGVSSTSLLALPAFLASAFGASDFLTTIFSETFEDVSFTKALEQWLSLTNEQKSLLDGTQKNWTQPVFVKTAQDLISRINDERSKIFNAHQGKFGSQWLNVVHCKNLGLKLDDQHIEFQLVCVSVPTSVLRIRATVVKELNGTVYTVFLAPRVLVASHVMVLSILIEQTLGSLDLPSVLEQLGLY